MSSKPTGLRFSSVSSQTSQSQPTKSTTNFTAKNSTISIVGKKPSTIVYTKTIKPNPTQTMQTTKKLAAANQSPYGSDTDISTSNENLSMEQRYVLRHTPRVEPQGQENLMESNQSGNENSVRYATDQQRFSSNTSSDSTRYASSSRSHSGSQTPILGGVQQTNNTTNESIIETTDNGSTSNHENSCPSSSCETSITPGNSDEQIEKKVTSCSNDGDEPEAIVETTNNDENSPVEMEAHQLPSSSTEEDNCSASIENDVAMRIGTNVGDTSILAKSSEDNKMNIKENTIDCAVDSSGVINKCDSKIIDDVPNNVVNEEKAILNESVSDVPTIIEPDELDSRHELDETASNSVDMTPELAKTCNSSSATSNGDTKCVEETNNDTKTEQDDEKHEAKEEDEKEVDTNNVLCDSVDSVEKDAEQISSVRNDEIVVSSDDAAATNDQLDRKIEEIERIEADGSVNTEKQAENGSNDCDSSDILVENHVESNVNGAISLTNTMPETCNEETDNTNGQVQEAAEETVQPQQQNDENDKNDKIEDVVEPIQIDVQTDEKPSIDNTEENDVQTQMDIDPETTVKDVNEQTTCETASNNCISALNCSDSTPDTLKLNEEKTKCAYDVSSPEIAPIGFKDKFKKSFEIMEKTKQELNLIEKSDKENDEQNKTSNINIKSEPCEKLHQANVMNENDPNTSNEVLKPNASPLPQNTNEIGGNVNHTYDLTENDKKHKSSDTSNEPQTNCNPIKEKLKRQEFATIQNKLSTHSSLGASEERQTQQQPSQPADSQKEVNKSSIASETRTIIVSPTNRARSSQFQSTSDEPKAVSNADSLSGKCGSLYVDNPDFSKSLRPSLRDLSELKMKPPDFTKLARSSELHVPNPDFTKAYDSINDTQSQSPIPSDVNPSNFAEISKKYNYISDLQLKNPLPSTHKANEPTQSTCSSLYVKPPDFSSKLRNQTDNESEAAGEPIPHIIHKNMYRPHADSSSKMSTPPPRSTPIQVEYPQISEDVTMSLVEQKISQAKSKPPTPTHRTEARVTVPNAPQPPQQPQSHIYSPTPHERHNSLNFYQHPVHSGEKSMPTIQKIYNDETYQRNLASSPAHHQYSSSAHIYHHRDMPAAIASNQKVHHTYESYPPMDKSALSKTNHPTMEVNAIRQSNDPYTRPASTTSYNMHAHEQNRLRPIHSAQEVQPSNANHINAYNYPSGRPASAHSLPKAAEYYNQMNPPQKWPSQSRITQSPISTAPSPHSISGQNPSTSQNQHPISASPLPYQMHRQSPSNLQYHSPHTTPSPSPFGYSPSPVPVPVKSNKLPTNAPVNNIPSQKKHNDYTLPVGTANATDKKQLSNSLSDLKTKMKDGSRNKESSHDPRDQYQQMSAHHRSSSAGRNSAKPDAKYTERNDYKRPNTILDPYVFRQASDTDVNYQIIKKTLNKEIPTPSFNRKHADLNAGLLLSSRMNFQPSHLLSNRNDAMTMRKEKSTSDPPSRFVYLDSKPPHEMYSDKVPKQNELNKLQYQSAQHQHQLQHQQQQQQHHQHQNQQQHQNQHQHQHQQYHFMQSTENHTKYDQRAIHSASTSNHQYPGPTNARQQIPGNPTPQSKTMSQGASDVEMNHVPYEMSVRPKMEPKKEKEKSTPTATPTPTPPVQQQLQPTNSSVNDVSSTKSSSTLFGPTKRESPLDLSVKTVVVKADSTGVYDYSLPARRQETIPPSLKVDFAPNFTNSPSDANRNVGNYRPQSRNETLPAPAAIINNIISNHINNSSVNSPAPVGHPVFSQMEHHQRHPPNLPQYNANIDASGRYKLSVGENNNSYATLRPNSRVTPTEPKSRKDTKMPTIFGQKPEDLKNFNENNANVNESSGSNPAFNKSDDKMNATPTAKYHPNEKELAYRGNQMHGYPNIQAAPMRQADRQSEVIQFVSHSRPQSVNMPPRTATTEQYKQNAPYPHYNHYDTVHRRHLPQPMHGQQQQQPQPQPPQSQSQLQPNFNHAQSKSEFATPNKMLDERYKMSHSYGERTEVHYPSAGNLPQKRPSESVIEGAPGKQARYDVNHHEEVKYQQNVNNHPYYSAQDRNMPMYMSQYPPNLKPNERAISTPVIVQPQHTIPNETKYHFHPYANMNNDSKQPIPMRPNETYEQSKANAQPYRQPQFYPNHYPPVIKTPSTSTFEVKGAPHPIYNNIYESTGRPYKWPKTCDNNEHPLEYGSRPSFEHHPTPSNRIESSVIKTAESIKTETHEPVRANVTNNNSAISNNNNVPKAVDQSVISKLRNNLELKEMEKQKLLRTQNNSERTEEVNKNDLASIFAARIRTKGELKGYNPISTTNAECPPSTDTSLNVNAVDPVPKSDTKIVMKSETKFTDGLAGLDLMDWGSTCNDFLEQLQNNGDKQRSKAQRRFKLDDNVDKKLSENIIPSKLVEKSSDDKSKQVKPTTTSKSQSQPQSQNNDATSSDEDKPLLFLRQQSLSENSKNRKTMSSSGEREKVLPNRKKTKLDKQSPNKRNENKNRLNIESSSDSEEEADRFTRRSKKVIRKPRTRSSISNRVGDDEDDSDTTVCTSNKNDKSSKKRNRKEKSSSESEVDANRNSKKRKSLEVSESDDDDEETVLSSYSAKKRPQPMKVEETMTRSKRKRELELEIANSKVLRNDKLVKCNAITSEKRSNESKSVLEKKQSSKNSDAADKGKGSDSSKSQRSKSTELKKKTNDSDADTTPKKSTLLKKKLRNSRQQLSSSDSESSSSSGNDEIIAERLRSRNPKPTNPTSDSDANKASKKDEHKPSCSTSVGESADEKLSSKKSNKNTPKKNVTDFDMSEDSRSQFPPGWEEQAYEYKRSLKIPARLITIGRPSWHQHRKSTSLPDLDPQHSSDASETFVEVNRKSAGSSSATRKGKQNHKKVSDSSTPMNNDSDNAVSDLKSKSIIDLLHQRVSRPTIKKKSKNQVAQNEPKILPQSNEVELLPTPGSEGKPENVFKSENVFETAVLKSRTRKEYKAMKTQEIIREVFGGEDRPASAPPYNFEVVQQKLQTIQQKTQQSTSGQQDTKPLTFDQQYQQYLEKLNVDYGEKIRKVKNLADSKNDAELGRLVPKVEKIDDQDDESHDTELNDCEERNIDDNKEGREDTPSVTSEIDRATPTSFGGVLKTKKGRGNRYGRRKGSSGFDYIRKKKKPLPQPSSSQGTPALVKRRSAAINYLEIKNENDITREIRSWVLNKGVGESVLHKAARLGYIDVVVYCLERLEMAPDQKDNAGYTPLHEACSRGLTNIARVLLQYGANHSETAHSGIRPLHEAVDNGYVEIVRLLLSYGADPLLATYAGQTPIMLAEDDDEMVSFLKNHLIDVQNTGPNKMPWKFGGPWKMNDPDYIGYDVFDDLPEDIEPVQKQTKPVQEPCTSTTPEKVIKTPKRKSPLRCKSKQKDVIDAKTEVNENVNGEVTGGDSDAEVFEIEESETPLIPLYQLRDEGATKWVLLSDLCYLLKVKSKETLLKMLHPGSSPTSNANQKDLLRELKMSEFLEKAVCLQLLCAGEKLNIRSSKVTLVKYNESVKNALGVKTIKMRL